MGGEIDWRPGWRRGGWSEFLGNPWGHFRVRLVDGTMLSYSANDKNLAWWRQLWFVGSIKRTPKKIGS
jgi:hypothetical protein